MKPGEPTGTTYKVPGHECTCGDAPAHGAMVRIHGRGPWACQTAVNRGRDWEREEVAAHADHLVAVVMGRTDMDPAFLKVFAAGIRAYADEIARKAHVTE